MSAEHDLDRSLVHHDWDNAYAPVLSISSGDIVHFDLPITGEGQVEETSRVDDVTWDWDTIYNLAGPIHVEGARPGDTLQIDVLDLAPGPWGWTALMPETGLLPDDFPDPYLRIFDLRNAAREASAEVAGAVAFACLPGVFGVLAGCSPWESGALAVVMCGRAVPTVLTVRAALRATKTGEGGVGPALVCALVALAAGLFCALAGWIGWAGPVGLAVLAARSFVLLVFPRPVLRARTLGLSEAMVGLAFVVVVAAAWRA